MEACVKQSIAFFLSSQYNTPRYMDTFALETSSRPSAAKAKSLRRQGKIPAVYYGRGKGSVSLQLDYHAFRKVFATAGENTLIDLSVDGKKVPVLVHDVQYDPVTDQISHVDFIHVDMEKEVTTSVKVTVLGVAPAVKNLGGILDLQKHEIKIRCLPKDLIHGIEVDVSGIVDFHTSVHVKDLKIPSAVKVLDNPEDTVVTATPPRAEEEAKPAEAAAAAAPGAEGAAAAPAAGAAAPPAEGAAGAAK